MPRCTKWCENSPIERGNLQRVLSAARRSRNARVGVRVDLCAVVSASRYAQKKTANPSGCRNPLPLEPRGRASRLFPVGRIRRPGRWLRVFAAYQRSSPSAARLPYDFSRTHVCTSFVRRVDQIPDDMIRRGHPLPLTPPLLHVFYVAGGQMVRAQPGAAYTTACITALRPGASPPPVVIAIRRISTRNSNSWRRCPPQFASCAIRHTRPPGCALRHTCSRLSTSTILDQGAPDVPLLVRAFRRIVPAVHRYGPILAEE